MQAFGHFSNSTGLQANKHNSQAYIARTSKASQQEILTFLLFESNFSLNLALFELVDPKIKHQVLVISFFSEFQYCPIHPT